MAFAQWITICTSWLFTAFHPNSGSDLTVEINGLRNDKGWVLINMFNNASGFPGAAEKAYKKEKAEVRNGRCQIKFSSLIDGTYAIAVLHDENKNLKMDTKLLMLPKEGFGFSQNAPLTFGPPSFAKASFRHSGVQVLIIHMKYF